MSKKAIKDLKYFAAPSVSIGARYGIIFMSLLILFFFTWASFHTINITDIAFGKLEFSKGIINIQSQVDGIIDKVYVEDNKTIKKGMPILKITTEKEETEQLALSTKVAIDEINLIRLHAVIHKSELNFPENLEKEYPDIIYNQKLIYKTDMKILDEYYSLLKTNESLANEELNMLLPLVEDGTMSNADLITAKEKMTRIKSQVYKFENDFFKRLVDQYSQFKSNLVIDKKNLESLNSRLEKNIITSPSDGIIHNLELKKGEVVKTGDSILFILPSVRDFIVEAEIMPTDIGFIDVGQQVNIMLDAYDFTIYGSLNGEISEISSYTAVSYTHLTLPTILLV